MSAQTTTVTRPPLRYHGSKWRLAPWIISFLPPHRVYVEPYAGGAAVLLRKPQSDLEVYNDADGAVVNFFRVLREQPGELMRVVELTPFAHSELDLSYQPCDEPIEAARRFYVRSWQGRGGGRAGLVDSWRVGWRRSKDPDGPRAVEEWALTDRILNVAARLRRVQIEQADALSVIRRYDQPGALFYVDPPYMTETRGRWKNTGYAHEMTSDDHRLLAETLHSIEGMALVSGYDCALYRELYERWRVVTCEAKSDGGFARTECLWLSPSITAGVFQQSLLEIQ